MLTIKNISKSFDNFSVIENVDFNLEEGKIYGLIGKNGEGKTTLLNCLCGVLTPSDGDIFYNGRSIYDDLISYKKDIAYTPDECSALEYLTGREYLEFIFSVFYKAKSKEEKKNNINILKEKVLSLSKLLNYEKYLDKKIALYSHGTKQKVSLIAACIHDPKIWYLDEPLLGLDPIAIKGLYKLFNDLKKRNGTVFFSVHDLTACKEMCDDVLLMDNKKISKIYKDVKNDKNFIDDISQALRK